jgi:hypothetical protein
LAIGCDYQPNRGTYQYQADDVLTDDCSLVPASKILWSGELARSGSFLSLSTGFHDITAVGYYLAASQRFSVDGTATQIVDTVRGQSCQLDWIGLHIDASPTSDTAFGGNLRIQYQDLDAEACQCELDATFTATLQ